MTYLKDNAPEEEAKAFEGSAIGAFKGLKNFKKDSPPGFYVGESGSTEGMYVYFSHLPSELVNY